MNIIVASDPNGVIGKGNKIPWYLPGDLKLFKQRTMGHAVIMGRLTWESLPKKPLPGRTNYVISRTDCAPAIWCKSLLEAVGLAGSGFIIGGEQVYKEALRCDVVEQIILSKLHDCYDGDRYFHVPDGWIVIESQPYDKFDVLYLKKH